MIKKRTKSRFQKTLFSRTMHLIELQEAIQKKKRERESGIGKLTSSNFRAISENAFRMASVEPVTVTMRSGHEPSEMLILAPL